MQIADPAPPVAAAPTPPDGSPRVRTRSARLDDLRPASAARPLRVRITSLGIDAEVDAVGVRPSGELDVPRSTTSVGWYRLGAGPGDAGSAVLAAHVTYNGADGPFRQLARIGRGAAVSVEMRDGAQRRFRVVSARSYAKESLPTEEIFSTAGPARLALITCGGEYDAQRGGYPENVVVYAVPA